MRVSDEEATRFRDVDGVPTERRLAADLLDARRERDEARAALRDLWDDLAERPGMFVNLPGVINANRDAVLAAIGVTMTDSIAGTSPVPITVDPDITSPTHYYINSTPPAPDPLRVAEAVREAMIEVCRGLKAGPWSEYERGVGALAHAIDEIEEVDLPAIVAKVKPYPTSTNPPLNSAA